MKQTIRLTENRLRLIISECVKRVINENRIVTFNGRTYPNNGWCVILSGGSGSGKGYVIANQLPIDGKVIDVDEFKDYLIRMNGGYINGERYNPRDAEHVKMAHFLVKQKQWKEKVRNNVLNPETHHIERLPNVIFDISGSEPDKDVVTIAEQAKECGYNTMLVWVVSNRSEAIIRNLQRNRCVKDDILHYIHNSIAINMPQFLKSSTSSDCIDDAWIIFSSTENITQPEFTDEEKKNLAVRLNRTDNGFKTDNDTINRLYRYLGEIETDVENPKVYMRSDVVMDRFGEKTANKVIKPNWSDLSKPKAVEYSGYRINRSKLPTKDLLTKNNP